MTTATDLNTHSLLKGDSLLSSHPIVYLTTREEKVLGLFSRTVRETFLESSDMRGYKKGHVAIFEKIPVVGSKEYIQVGVIDPSHPTEKGYKMAWVRKSDFQVVSSPMKQEAALIQKNFQVASYANAVNYPSVGSHVNTLVQGSPDTGLSGGLRMMSASAAIYGSIAVSASCDMYQVAKEIDDIAGQRIALLRGIMGSAQVAFGATSLGSRIAVITHSSIHTKAGALAIKILGIVANVFYSVVMGALFVRMAYLLKGSITCLNGLLKALKVNVQSGLAFLMEKLSVEKDTYDKAIPSLKTKEDVYLFMREKKALTAEEEAILSSTDLIEIQERAERMGKNFHDSDQEQIIHYVTLSMMKTVASVKLQKRADFIRSFGSDAYQRVFQEGEALLAVLKKEPTNKVALEKAGEITEIAKKMAKKQVLIRVLYCLAAVFGIAGGIAGIFFTGGIPLIVVTAIALFGALAIMISDLLIFIQESEALQHFTKKDFLLQAVLIAITIASIVLGSIFSGGLLPLIIVGVVGGGMLMTQLGTLIYAWYKTKNHAPYPKESSAQEEEARRPLLAADDLASEAV